MGLTFYFFQVVQVLAAVVLVVFIIRWPGPWDGSRIVGSILIVIGTAMVFTARSQLGKSFSVTPQARSLVTRGIYSKIRNPIYTFGLLAFLGLALIVHRRVLWWLFAALVPLQIFRAHKEAKVLQAKFGDSYQEYRRKTWF
jgi:protein-S-isoprenylcysteine O-methyltransferase Ste14